MNRAVELTHPGWISNEDKTLYYWTNTDRPSIPMSLVQSPLSQSELAVLPGSWALVDLRGDAPLLVSDPTASRPLYYAKADGRWIIADDIALFQKNVPWRLDGPQSEVFRHFGYSLGGGTLVASVRTVQAGTQVELCERGAKEDTYLKYRFVSDRERDPEVFADAFSDALDSAFARMRDCYRDSQFIVPLSGGLDSRLLLSWLRRLGIDDVLTFSYGRPNSEASQAEVVADSLGYEFVNLTYDELAMWSRWHGSSGEFFREHTWSGIALPHIQDWEAVRQLKEQTIISDQAVFLPGHTIVGNMHDEWLLQSKRPTKLIYDALADHHGNLQGQKSQVLHNRLFLRTVREILSDVGYDGEPGAVQAAVEWFNLRERQAKYINNSMRGYESYGYRWALPMLDREMWDVWLRGAEALTATRDWYAAFVAQAYEDAGGEQISLYDPRTTLTKKYIKSGVVQRIGRSAMGPFLNNLRVALIDKKHPLGFEAFDTSDSRLSLMWARARGITRVGQWSEAFLANRWGGSGPVPTSVEGY
ncbi:asparagine synthase [Actinomycetaceae bacterium WB03_NA08]|uniref:asparagine synthase (glutamine-hydrolyzing) n=1 Tax=Scrofimicrobium canadense TaxID=2652290 RepID=A0A6N7VP43_9ACTO|nr:asparagine synthase [Scrofimicrobium canadense]MSS83467.1 asparagine synthase [Scrofimicrobium canadense]